MSDNNNLQDNAPSSPAAERSSPAEEKRLAARRRFLQKSAAGSGVAVLTLYHTKGYAGDKGKKMILSSAQACMSLTGTPGKTVKKQDSVVPYVFDENGHKKKNIVNKQECVLK